MQEMHRPSTTLDSDFYRLSADDGPVWWLRGDPQCEPPWHPIEIEGAARFDPHDPSRFKLPPKERRGSRRTAAIGTRRDLRFVRVQQVMRVSAVFLDKLASRVPSFYHRPLKRA
jgi:hypothetical protein